jgi:undecaprenyl diphosphate synthase
MDGNGRWAISRGLPRVAGHRKGADAVRRIVEAAPGLGIGTLTLYAFSSDNWKRPPEEVSALMRLFRAYLERETERCVTEGVRLRVIGRRDRLPAWLPEVIERAERATAGGTGLTLRIAVDYSSRDAILRAVALWHADRVPERDEFARLLGMADASGESAPDVDFVLRTSGEQRLSDYLLWESAYAELIFTPRLWPDMDSGDLARAVEEFQSRNRRFGAVAPKVAAG